MTSARRIHVMIVDDSALMRRVLATLLEQQPGFRVTTAADPLIALRKITTDRPDVILLDLEMPRMDGLSFLRRLMQEDPIPVVICSGYAESGNARSLEALAAGAVKVIAKPKLGLREFLETAAAQMSKAIRDAAGTAQAPDASAPREPNRSQSSNQTTSRTKPQASRKPSAAQSTLGSGTSTTAEPFGGKVIAVGASTGGPEAIRRLLQELPVETPPVVIVQHMPEAFTGAFAARLNALTALEVSEARDGERLRRGQVLIAPGDHHVRLLPDGGDLKVQLDGGPPICGHRPSVDVLFRSVAKAAKELAVGILLTGMGRDGVLGLLEIQQQGGLTLAQDETSSVVYGMPKEAALRGAVSHQAPVERLARLALERLWQDNSQPHVAGVAR